MAKNLNNLNISIFTALKASEMSKIPVLLLSNPGVGKTSTVYLFAKVRGYEVVLLRGNSSSAEEITGYEVSPSNVTNEKPMSSIRLRPSWMEKILKYKEEGKKTLLFLDELTTANEFVQAALLHLIFERTCGNDVLPDDTLIVSAGNYASNLSASMGLLPPIMNRFMIFNIIPTVEDLKIFLNKYDGAMLSGKPNNYLSELEDVLREIDAQETKVDEVRLNKIGYRIEHGLLETARSLMVSGEKPVDLSETELGDIYSGNMNGDPRVYGFVTLRSLNYLRDITIAYYLAFGKAGLASDNYRNAIDGLCGVGLHRVKVGNNSESEVQMTVVSKYFFDAMNVVANDIEKDNNSKINLYTDYFGQVVDEQTTPMFEMPHIQTTFNKVEELLADKELEQIERPIDEEVISKLSKRILEFSKCFSKIRYSTGQGKTIKDVISLEDLAGIVTTWNAVAKLTVSVNKLCRDNTRGYSADLKAKLDEDTKKISTTGVRIRTIRHEYRDVEAGIIPALEKIEIK